MTIVNKVDYTIYIRLRHVTNKELMTNKYLQHEIRLFIHAKSMHFRALALFTLLDNNLVESVVLHL